MDPQLPPHEVRRLEVVAAGDPAKLIELTRRRMAGEPLQYLEGSAAFGPFDLQVDARVLIPRPETEQLWELVRSESQDPNVVVDLCTGSGALAIACKASWPDARVVATDLSADALEVATLNVAMAGLQIEVLAGDLFAPLPPALAGHVDLIVSNPPYVTEEEWAVLPVDVKAEPRMALVAGPSGLEVLGRIAEEASYWLAPGGLLVCEIGETQGSAAVTLFGSSLEGVEVRRDLSGRDRFVVARLPPSR